MAAHPKRKYTLEEYFDLELSTNERFEYWNGEIFMMSGGSDAHDQINEVYRDVTFPAKPPPNIKEPADSLSESRSDPIQ